MPCATYSSFLKKLFGIAGIQDAAFQFRTQLFCLRGAVLESKQGKGSQQRKHPNQHVWQA